MRSGDYLICMNTYTVGGGAMEYKFNVGEKCQINILPNDSAIVQKNDGSGAILSIETIELHFEGIASYRKRIIEELL